MVRNQLLYEGKAKKIYLSGVENVLKVEYLDQVTALNGARKDQIAGKGSLNNQITSIIFDKLSRQGIKNHFIKKISKNEQLIESLTIIKLEVVVRNVAAGSFSKRLGVAEGTQLTFPVLEFYYKEDRLDDPFINEDHIKFLKLATEDEIVLLKKQALEINEALKQIFSNIEIQLIDFKLEFGRRSDGTLLLADEITPDTCRLWDRQTNARLDKDIYRKKLGSLIPVYEEVVTRFENEKA